ncbi:MAG: hypothetical protein VYA30_01895 [Myxococcota bacterium]|nr:hypothetical protein [Myxococcota bacterium]
MSRLSHASDSVRRLATVVFILPCIITGCSSIKVRSDTLGVCRGDFKQMEPSWRPPKDIRFKPSDLPWTRAELAESDLAINSGLKEMAELVGDDESRVRKLWDNSVEAFLNTAYASRPDDPLAGQALKIADENFMVIARPYLGQKTHPATCIYAADYLTLAIYALELDKRLGPENRKGAVRAQLLSRTNRAIADCGGLSGLLGFDPQMVLRTVDAANDQVYGWVMWSVTLSDALAKPAITLPVGSQKFVGEVWRYLATYQVPLARDAAGGMNQDDVYDGAYLMTHIGYIPTGYGRHKLFVDDGPWLYRYIRENYYDAMQLGELDLFAEFVDLLRQYGCTEDNDAQLRHGSRYLLHLYRRAGGKWLKHREPYEGAEISDYDALHKPWTAIAGLRRRLFERKQGRSYRAAFERAILSVGQGVNQP